MCGGGGGGGVGGGDRGLICLESDSPPPPAGYRRHVERHVQHLKHVNPGRGRRAPRL